MTARLGEPELTYTEESNFQTGRQMAEVDYVIGAPFATTWQTEPRSRAFWAGYAHGWIDAEEVAQTARELAAIGDPFEEDEGEPYVPEDQFELDCVYLDLMGKW